MQRIFDNKLFPILTVLFSIGLGTVSSFLGADTTTAILIGILTELWITVHKALFKIDDIEKLLGNTKGISSMITLIPKIHKVLSYNNKWSNIIYSSKLEKLSLEINNMEKRRIPLNADEFMEFAEKLFNTLSKKDKLFATSLFGGGTYWTRKYGIRYAKLNENAQRQGANITRVFIVKNDEEAKQFDEIFQEQAKYINVLVADFETVTEVNRLLLKDFFILNNEIVVEFVFDAVFKEIDSIIVILDKEEISNYTKRMNQLLELSNQYG